MAELWGRATGCRGGRGGTMHLHDFSLGYPRANGIVGAALGDRDGRRTRGEAARVRPGRVGFVGDGGANTGRTWESVNFAAIWKLPLIVVCENNQYAVETLDRAADRRRRRSPSARDGFGLPAVRSTARTSRAVYRATAEARERAASGDGPDLHRGGHLPLPRATTPGRSRTTGRSRRSSAGGDAATRSSGCAARSRRPAGSTTRRFDAADRERRARSSRMRSRSRRARRFPDPATAADGVTAFAFDARGPG